MYGGGFATIPAYLADLFGTQMVGAIHGRLLTAWSVAGILGPVLVNYLNEFQVSAGVPRGSAYDQTMYLLAGLLVAGFFCNLFVRPVQEKFFTVAEKPAGEGLVGNPPAALHELADGAGCDLAGNVHGSPVLLFLFWLLVAVPLALGVLTTIGQAWVLFG
jgi:hypothetical protein